MSHAYRPLTAVAQQLVAQVVQPGDTVVDATAGNGHDTLFLAQQVGPTGRVFAIDIQTAAIESTTCQLQLANIHHVTLLHNDHSQLENLLPAQLRGQLAAAMFNLGYLPGGDKSITTQPGTTLTALHTTMSWLRLGGLITLLIYSGHEVGQRELTTLLEFLEAPQSSFQIVEVDPQPLRHHPPRLFTIHRRSPEDTVLS